jgi:hypothetical protein
MKNFPAPSCPRSSTPRSVSAYDELYNKALRHARANGLDTSRQAIDRVVRMGLEARRNSLVNCPACGIKRRNAHFEFCSECARLAREEDARQAKSGACTPTREESARLSDEIIRDQRNAAARELHRLYLANKLPEGCVVECESRRQVRIQTPLAMFVLLAAEPKRRPQSASVIELTLEQIDAGWDTIAA